MGVQLQATSNRITSVVREVCRNQGIKEVEHPLGIRIKSGSRAPHCAVVSVRVSKVPPNDELQYGHRVPYIIIRGELNGRLVDLHR